MAGGKKFRHSGHPRASARQKESREHFIREDATLLQEVLGNRHRHEPNQTDPEKPHGIPSMSPGHRQQNFREGIVQSTVQADS